MLVARILVAVLATSFMLTALQGCGGTTVTTTPYCRGAYYNYQCQFQQPFAQCCNKIPCPLIGGSSDSGCQWSVSNGGDAVKGDGFEEDTTECYEACNVLGHKSTKDPFDFCKDGVIEKRISKCQVAVKDLQKQQLKMNWCPKQSLIFTSSSSRGVTSAKSYNGELKHFKNQSQNVTDDSDECKHAYWDIGCQIQAPFTQCCSGCPISGGGSSSSCSWHVTGGPHNTTVKGTAFDEPTEECFKACEFLGDHSKHPDPEDFCPGQAVEKNEDVKSCFAALTALNYTQKEMTWC